MGKIVGIDLGTTNSCIAITEGTTPTVIVNREGSRTTPSIVSFSEKGSQERKVGMAAKRQAAINVQNSVYSIKRFMGKPYEEVKETAEAMPYKIIKGKKGDCNVRIGNRDYTPQEISAMILQELKAAGESFLGHKIKKAVITVPAYFNDQERQATKEAGTIAGLDVVRIINEPTAAALAHGLGKGKENLKIVVYDFGGGTFDVSILEREDGVFEVKATNGDVHLGGDNFDERIMAWLIDQFKQEKNIDLSKDVRAMGRLKEAAEKAKKELSTAQTTEINLPYIAGNQHLVVELHRSKFEQLCDDLIARSMTPCQNALKASGFSINDIDEVILVGGSTRIPRIQQEVQNFFKKAPSKNVHPDEVVALGAAVQGGIIAGDVRGIVLLDVTPLSLGIETLGGVFTKLIEANTTIPTKKSQIFSTAENNQDKVYIQVCQGERAMARDNKLLGQFILDNIPPAPRGKPQIEVTFDIDANGIVCVTAKDMDTGKVKDIRIEGSSSLTKEEVTRMKREAEMHAEKDKKEKEKVEKLNKADNTIFEMEKSLRENKDKLTEEMKKQIEELLSQFKKAYEAKDVDRLDFLQKEYNKAWVKMLDEVAKANQQAKEAGEQGKDKVKDAEYEDVKKDNNPS